MEAGKQEVDQLFKEVGCFQESHSEVKYILSSFQKHFVGQCGTTYAETIGKELRPFSQLVSAVKAQLDQHPGQDVLPLLSQMLAKHSEMTSRFN